MTLTSPLPGRVEPGPSTYQTTAEVADTFRVSKRKVLETAVRVGVGANFGGRAGYRFTDDDVRAMAEALRPAAPVAPRRRRRAAA